MILRIYFSEKNKLEIQYVGEKIRIKGNFVSLTNIILKIHEPLTQGERNG